MKKILLIAIIALAINAFAQNKQPANPMLGGKAIFSEKDQSLIKSRGLKIAGMHLTLNQDQSVNQQLSEPIQIWDSVINWQWSTSAGAWEPWLKFMNMVYDGNNNLISFVGRDWNGSAWGEVSHQQTDTYDASHHRLISYTYSNWNGSTWEHYTKYSYTWDANNNLTNELTQYGSGLALENYYQKTYTYDANNNQLSALNQNWGTGSWDNISRYTRTFDASNKEISELVEIWDNGAWTNRWKYTFTYNAGNTLTSNQQQKWVGSQWLDSGKTTYTYDGSDNLINTLFATFNGSDWSNSSQHIYTYDANKNKTSDLRQSFNGTDWYNYSQEIYAFDAYNFKIDHSYKSWNSTGSAITSGDSTHYYLHTMFTGLTGLKDDNAMVYPNPSKGKLTINSSSPITAIEVYNLSGKKIYSGLNIKQQTLSEIDLSGYAKGIYVLKIYNGTKSYNRKVIVQ